MPQEWTASCQPTMKEKVRSHGSCNPAPKAPVVGVNLDSISFVVSLRWACVRWSVGRAAQKLVDFCASAEAQS